jgi:hypothetical protein
MFSANRVEVAVGREDADDIGLPRGHLSGYRSSALVIAALDL